MQRIIGPPNRVSLIVDITGDTALLAMRLISRMERSATIVPKKNNAIAINATMARIHDVLTM